MKKINYMLEIDILRNSSHLWVSRGVLFKGLGIQKDTKMPCWLRPCSGHLKLSVSIFLKCQFQAYIIIGFFPPQYSSHDIV